MATVENEINTTYSFSRGIDLSTYYSNNFPYNAILNEKLNNNQESINVVLENNKIFQNRSTSTGQFTFRNKDEQCLQNFVDYFHKFDTKNKDFSNIINDYKIHDVLNNKIKNKENFEILFIQLKKNLKYINQKIKAKYLYIRVQWKQIRQCGFFKSYKVILTISNQSKGNLIV